MMKYVGLFLVGLILFTGCKSEEVAQEFVNTSTYAEYFYATDSLEPYIYAYRDDAKPLDERFHRIYNMLEDDTIFFVLEKYNSSFRIFEGFTLNLDETYSIQDHMVVDGNGQKRKTRVSSANYFPSKKGETVTFIADFPAPIDSLIMIYQSKRTIIEEGLKINIMDREMEVINLRDSITLYLVNPETKESSSQSSVTNNYYAKNYGLVKWGDIDEVVNYELRKIIPESWWQTNIMQ